MKEDLGRCGEYLRKAVVYLALNSGTPQEKLAAMLIHTGFGSIVKDDFPSGPMRDDYLAIRATLTNDSEPQIAVNVAAMSDDEVRKVIRNICELSDDVAHALCKLG
jgi:hypothetical protein